MKINEKIQQARVESVINAQKSAYSPQMKYKIQRFIDRYQLYQYSVEDIQKKIVEDELFAANFSSDPLRQNIVEKMIFLELSEFISGRGGSTTYLGSSSQYFLINGEITTVRQSGHKSIDAIIDYNGTTYAISQKYINERGGAQDNQFHDILTFIREGAKITSSRLKCVAIVDGGYFTPSKIDELTRFSNTETTEIVSFDSGGIYEIFG